MKADTNIKKQAISAILRVSVSLALILILLYIMRDKYNQIFDAIKGADPALLALGLAIFILAVFIASIRLRMIVDAKDKSSVTFREVVSLTFIGYFFNNFLPTSIGGDVAKAYYLSRKNSEKLSSYTAVFIDRAMGLFTMIMMAAVALLFVQNKIVDDSIRYMIYLITLGALFFALFMMNKNFAKKFMILIVFIKPIEDKVRKLYNSIHSYKNQGSLIVKSLAVSVVSQILFFLSIGVLALSIGSKIPAIEVLLRMPIISAVSLLPSINGLGVREGSTVVFFGPIIGKENAFVVSILWLLVLFIVSLIGGLIYAFSPQFKVKLGEIKKAEAL